MKKITLEKIAVKTGFSIKHVSRALAGAPRVSPESRSVIEAAARKLEYRKNGALTNRIAVISPVLFHWVDKVLHELALHGLQGVYFNTRSLDCLPEKLFDGAIGICGYDVFGRNWHRKYQIPLVLIHDSGVISESVSAVAEDFDHAVAQAYEHLAELNHRRIIWLRETIGSGKRYVSRGEKGFFSMAEKYHLLHTSKICNHTCLEQLLPAIKQALQDEFTGFIINDFGHYRRILELFESCSCRIPEDASLIVYDCDETTDCYEPELTALKIDYAAINRTAVRLLQDIINGENAVRQISIPSKLIVRKSTGVCRQ